jgi:hypothetical protein
MNKIVVGHYLADGGIVYLPIGFIPDYFRLCDIDSTTTNAAVCIHEWFERMEDDEASGSQEGWALGLSTLGYTTLHADDAGITAYDTGTQYPTVAQWVASTAYTARTATASGSFVKGTTSGTDNLGQAVDRDAIFECVTAGTSGSTEPTWPSRIGGQVLDSTPVWEKVNEATFRGGYQGVCIQDDIQTNTHECYYLALKADDSIDHGDVDGWPSGVDQDWV